MKITGKNIILTFADEETANYINTICKRKGTTLEDYIIDNFEWDDQLECLDGATKEMCEYCDYADKCPDMVR